MATANLTTQQQNNNNNSNLITDDVKNYMIGLESQAQQTIQNAAKDGTIDEFKHVLEEYKFDMKMIKDMSKQDFDRFRSWCKFLSITKSNAGQADASNGWTEEKIGQIAVEAARLDYGPAFVKLARAGKKRIGHSRIDNVVANISNSRTKTKLGDLKEDTEQQFGEIKGDLNETKSSLNSDRIQSKFWYDFGVVLAFFITMSNISFITFINSTSWVIAFWFGIECVNFIIFIVLVSLKQPIIYILNNSGIKWKFTDNNFWKIQRLRCALVSSFIYFANFGLFENSRIGWNVGIGFGVCCLLIECIIFSWTMYDANQYYSRNRRLKENNNDDGRIVMTSNVNDNMNNNMNDNVNGKRIAIQMNTSNHLTINDANSKDKDSSNNNKNVVMANRSDGEGSSTHSGDGVRKPQTPSSIDKAKSGGSTVSVGSANGQEYDEIVNYFGKYAPKNA